MSEEVLQAAGDIAFWRKRAEQAEAMARTLQTQRDRAEADTAAMKEVLIYRHTCENCGGGRGYYWTDVNGEAESEVCDCWIRAEHAIYHEEHPGATLLAALLAELEAARTVVATYRVEPRHYDDTWCEPGQNDPYYAWLARMAELVAAYDAAVKVK